MAWSDWSRADTTRSDGLRDHVARSGWDGAERYFRADIQVRPYQYVCVVLTHNIVQVLGKWFA